MGTTPSALKSPSTSAPGQALAQAQEDKAEDRAWAAAKLAPPPVVPHGYNWDEFYDSVGGIYETHQENRWAQECFKRTRGPCRGHHGRPRGSLQNRWPRAAVGSAKLRHDGRIQDASASIQSGGLPASKRRAKNAGLLAYEKTGYDKTGQASRRLCLICGQSA